MVQNSGLTLKRWAQTSVCSGSLWVLGPIGLNIPCASASSHRPRERSQEVHFAYSSAGEMEAVCET